MGVQQDVIGEDWLPLETGPVMVCTVNGADTGQYGTILSWLGRDWWIEDYRSRDAAVAGHHRWLDGLARTAFGPLA